MGHNFFFLDSVVIFEKGTKAFGVSLASSDFLSEPNFFFKKLCGCTPGCSFFGRGRDEGHKLERANEQEPTVERDRIGSKVRALGPH